jgi:glycosyltransferase involved in cell wall biosynthesis
MVQTPIRVAQVVGRMMGGGVESVVLNYYRHIDRTKIQFDFIAQSDSTCIPEDEITALGGRVFIVPPYQQISSYLSECQRIFSSEKPPIVHSHMNALSVFPLKAAKAAGVQIRIAHSHSTASSHELLKTVVKDTLRPFARVYPTHLAACSTAAGEWLFSKREVSSGRVRLIPNAIDLDKFKYSLNLRIQKRKELGLDAHQLVIGHVGRMCKQKNQLFIEEIFTQLLMNHPEAVLVFVGGGDMFVEVKKRAQTLGISDSVRFLGIRSDVAEIYNAFDILLFPSLYEGLGITAIEAQANNLPVLASTNVPSEVSIVPELLHQSRLSDSAAEWANQLARVVGDSERKLDVNSLIELQEAGYNIQHSSQKLCRWYFELVQQTKVGSYAS